MQIAILADDGEVIDSIDVERGEMQAALSGHNGERRMLWERLDTHPLRKFLGLDVRGASR